MIPRKLSISTQLEELIFRLRKYKSEKSLSYVQLIMAIIVRVASVTSYYIRRYRLIFDSDYDFYGWKSRSRLQAEEDLFHASAEKKNGYMQEQIDFKHTSTFLELGSNSGIQIFELAKIEAKMLSLNSPIKTLPTKLDLEARPQTVRMYSRLAESLVGRQFGFE